jgi:hypothetical protein
MAIKELTEHPLGVTWVIQEALTRASHGLVHDGRVWLIDVVDEPEALERAVPRGEVAAVLQLFIGHARDGEAVAKRLGVPFLRLPEVVPDAPFSVLSLDRWKWRERALWWPQERGLIVPESVGTGVAYAVGPGPAGVHPIRRLMPPNELRSFLPEHLLVGHGSPIHGGQAAAALLDALNRARRDIPTFVGKLPGLIRDMRSQT